VSVATFCTEYVDNGKAYAGDEIDAADWDTAEVEAKKRGWKVVGKLVWECDASELLVNPRGLGLLQ
jgi:hypothetical protein